mgnify:CR=1 FL=1
MLLNDPLVEEFVAQAQTSNLDLAQAVTRLRSARAGLRQARAARLPQITGSGGASRDVGDLASDDVQFSLGSAGNGTWKNTAFNFTGGLGGGTMNLLGNPIGDINTTNTFSTSGGATNTINGGLNANNANVTFSLAAASSGTTLHDGSFAALVFPSNSQGGFGLSNVGTLNIGGSGGVLFKDKLSASTINVNAGTLQMGDGTAATAAATADLTASQVAIASDAKVIFQRAEAATTSAAFSGSGSLQQAGAGTLTLTGNSNAFAGTTTVHNARSLAIGTGGSLGAAGSSLVLSNASASVAFTNTSGTSEVSVGYEKYWPNSTRTKTYNGLRCSSFY